MGFEVSPSLTIAHFLSITKSFLSETGTTFNDEGFPNLVPEVWRMLWFIKNTF
jgi:hypothetical protein